MFTNMISVISKSFQPILPQNTQPVAFNPKPVTAENPFAMPFITVQSKRAAFHGKNNPVQGGYFAGYYNGKQNIVGRNIFIDA